MLFFYSDTTMPNNYNKRKLEDFDPTASDPDDDDYDANADRTVSRSKPSKSQPKKRSKRTRHGGYDTDGSELLSEEDDLGEEDFEDEDDAPIQPVEISRSGRPVRKTAKIPKTYEEGDTDDDDLIQRSEPDEEEEKAKPKRGKGNQKKLVTLKLSTPRPEQAPVGRRSRAGSTARSRRGYSNEPTSAGTRRSSRLHADDNEPIIALSGSGRHAEIIRPATKSPETKPARATRGGKGLKQANPPSLIMEDEHENSSVPKDDEAEEEPETGGRGSRRSGSGRTRGTGGDGTYEVEAAPKTDTQNATQGDDDIDEDVQMVQESPVGVPEPRADTKPAPEQEDDDDEEDEEPISKRGRTRGSRVSVEPFTTSAGDAPASKEEALVNNQSNEQATRSSKSQRSKSEQGKKKKNGGNEEDSDFEAPDEDGDDDMSSDSAVSNESPRKGSAGNDEEDYESSNTRRSGRLAKGASRRGDSAVPEEEELAEELEELKAGDRPRRAPRATEIIYEDSRPSLRRRKREVDYRIVKPDANLFVDLIEDAAPSASPSRRSRATGGGVWQRNLFSTYGPFGGAGGPPPVFGRGMGATGGVDSDSSDDERMQRPTGFGGAVGMTPTTAAPPGLLAAGQTHNVDPIQGGLSGTPANLGKIKNRQALADADPLGVDQNVSFDKVGGLEDHINQLKEMVTLPLLYPEIFQRFKVTPPRGVLFHGPPGTGKTLLARALAASCSSEGRKITFYMRKGADALSKWVGEAERQLRLLFDEARNNQPSIIFFDEIDGMKSILLTEHTGRN